MSMVQYCSRHSRVRQQRRAMRYYGPNQTLHCIHNSFCRVQCLQFAQEHSTISLRVWFVTRACRLGAYTPITPAYALSWTGSTRTRIRQPRTQIRTRTTSEEQELDLQPLKTCKLQNKCYRQLDIQLQKVIRIAYKKLSCR